MSLLTDVDSCRACITRQERFAKGFALRPSQVPKKFPATIGAAGQAKLLFVALCPRLGRNYVLDWANESADRFASLSENRDQHGRAYVESYAANDGKEWEDFYRPYVEIAKAVYPGNAFEEVAAVTDLYLCAYPPNNRNEFDRDYVSLPVNSPCARDFMQRTIDQVKPVAIITRGCSPKEYFGMRYLRQRRLRYSTAYTMRINDLSTVLLPLRSGNQFGLPEIDKQWAIDELRKI
jgi:hypothetical protein